MTPEYTEYLTQEGYSEVRAIPNTNMWVGMMRFLFNWSIIVGNDEDRVGYEDRWDCTDFATTKDALDRWAANNFEGEPDSWVRHLKSGRRRVDGTKASEEYRP